MTYSTDQLIIADKAYNSRLLTGSGKYKDLEETREATEASGAEIVTVAIRRTNIGQNPDEPNLLDALPPEKRNEVRDEVGKFARDFIRDGKLVIPHEYLLISGNK